LGFLDYLYILGARALLAFTDFEFYGVTLLEYGTISVVRVHENVVTAILLDEPVTLVSVEPFDFAL
jgi:hypothetical protein